MNDNTIETQWEALLDQLQQLLGKRPADLNAVLFLIGVQELGKGPIRFSKEQKQDLMHIAVCRVLSQSGYYTYDGIDKDGWPHWQQLKPHPPGDVTAQENLLKQHVITYFQSVLV